VGFFKQSVFAMDNSLVMHSSTLYARLTEAEFILSTSGSSEVGVRPPSRVINSVGDVMNDDPKYMCRPSSLDSM